jgi:hypothetical protein
MHGTALIGYEFRLGAAGEDKQIDCIHMVLCTLSAMGIPAQEVRGAWYENDIRAILLDLTAWGDRIRDPGVEGDVLLHSSQGALSFGVISEGGLLHIHPVSRRVAWMPHKFFCGRWYRHIT